eukprot:3531822-Pyramimonas_sp.AAC.1
MYSHSGRAVEIPNVCVVVRVGLLLTCLPRSTVLRIARALQSQIHNCRLRPLSTMGHDMSPLCLCPAVYPAQAGAAAVLQLL